MDLRSKNSVECIKKISKFFNISYEDVENILYSNIAELIEHSTTFPEIKNIRRDSDNFSKTEKLSKKIPIPISNNNMIYKPSNSALEKSPFQSTKVIPFGDVVQQMIGMYVDHEVIAGVFGLTGAFGLDELYNKLSTINYNNYILNFNDSSIGIEISRLDDGTDEDSMEFDDMFVGLLLYKKLTFNDQGVIVSPVPIPELREQLRNLLKLDDDEPIDIIIK